MKNSDSPLKVIHPQPHRKKLSLQVESLSVWIEESLILKEVNLDIRKNSINCIVGPSGAGKSTLIRCFNRINDEKNDFHLQGAIYFNDLNIYGSDVNATQLRTQIGMVFQKPAVFPKSIRENVLFGIRHHKKLNRLEKLQIVEKKLKAVSLWQEVSHRLDDSAISLSAGQQQRLCLARTLAVDPQVILLDEPTSALDPISSKAIEDLMLKMKEDYTIVFVTHNIQQASRIADQIIFMCEGEIIESGSREQMFTNPGNEQTRSYLTDNYCDC